MIQAFFKQQKTVCRALYVAIVVALAALLLQEIYAVVQGDRHRPSYRLHWRLKAQLSGKKAAYKQAKLQQALAAYQQALSYQPHHPLYRFETARLHYELFLMKEQTQLRLTKARELLSEVCQTTPAWANPHHYLALVLQKQQQTAAAKKEMARSQILAPWRPTFAYQAALFWQQYLSSPSSLPLLNHALYGLNHYDFTTYGPYSLKLWQATQAQTSPIGAIVPVEEKFVVATLRLVIAQKQLPLAEKILQNWPLPENQATRWFWQGYLACLHGKFAQALKYYQQSWQQTPAADKAQAVTKITRALVHFNRLQRAMLFLQQIGQDTLEQRSDLLLFANKNGISKELLFAWLKDSERNFASLSPELLRLFSQLYYAKDQLQQALEYARKAVEQSQRQEKFVRHWYYLLFRSGLAARVNYDVKKNEHRLPLKASFYDWLASEYYKLHDYRSALYWAEKALGLEPGNSSIKRRVQRLHREIRKKQ